MILRGSYRNKGLIPQSLLPTPKLLGQPLEPMKQL